MIKLNQIADNRGQSLAQMAVAWVLKNDNVTSVLLGASKVSQIEEIVEGLNNPKFSKEELKIIDEICSK